MKILFVEDSEGILNQMKNILEDSHHQLTIARDGTEGLGELAMGEVDLVISDLHMPRMDGLTMLEFYECLRTQKIKKIMLTSDINPQLVEKGKKLGVIAWLTKPLSKNNVLNTLKKIEQDLGEK
tara:strand:- start:4052 stop:4423 length:372 start_codon:yes stop_codon:yes gene_type:complete